VALDAWADAHGITLSFSRPGKPVDNFFVKGVHDKLRDELLNLLWFLTLSEAGEVIYAWRVDSIHPGLTRAWGTARRVNGPTNCGRTSRTERASPSNLAQPN
jgi:hypothetical protein